MGGREGDWIRGEGMGRSCREERRMEGDGEIKMKEKGE